MYCKILTGAIQGIHSEIVRVEVDASNGLPGFEMVGLLNHEVKEAKERVKVALKNTKINIPPVRITVSILPADLRKEGAAYDVPIAIGVLTALGYIPQEYVKDTLMIGELGLNGEIRGVKGVLSLVKKAKEVGCKRCIVPWQNLEEALLIQGIAVMGVSSLHELYEYLQKDETQKLQLEQSKAQELEKDSTSDCTVLDFADINGQESVKRAIEVAAAGFHHVLMIGPPGSGKTMISKRIPSILPELTHEESLEVSTIYSVAGNLNANRALITKRPFMDPHHTISEQALAGGGRIPKPGIISLAHRGVLFLDEMPEFKRAALEILRQPLENKEVHIARTYGNYVYPADFMLVGAMNPCPCGHFPDRNKCLCAESDIRRYLNRISGPILDRIDILIEAPKVDIKLLSSQVENESSEQMKARVIEARERQEKRYQGTRYRFNAEIQAGDIRKYCALGTKEQELMEQAFTMMNLSARAYHKIIKVARTIADLAGEDQICCAHLSEAICYRMNDNQYWQQR